MPPGSESPMDWEYNNLGPLDPASPFTHFAQRSSRGRESQQGQADFDGSFAGLKTHSPAITAANSRLSRHTISQQQSLSQKPLSTQSNSSRPTSRFINPSFVSHHSQEPSGKDHRAQDIDDVATETKSFASPRARFLPPIPSANRTNCVTSAASSSPPRQSGRGDIPKPGQARHKVSKRQPYLRSPRSTAPPTHSIVLLPADGKLELRSMRTNLLVSDLGPGDGNLKKDESVPAGYLASPELLLKWLQLLVQCILMALFLYFIWYVFVSVKHDMYLAAEKARTERLANITACATHYHDNHCFPREQRLPRLVQDCDDWELCMNQDPDEIRAVTVGVKQLAEFLNELVAAMHYKTLTFLAGFILVGALATRLAGNQLLSLKHQGPYLEQPRFMVASGTTSHNRLKQQLGYNYRGELPRLLHDE